MLSNKNRGGEKSGVSALRWWFFSILLGIGLTVGAVSDFLVLLVLFFSSFFFLLNYCYLDPQVFRLLLFLFSPSIPLRQEGVSKWLYRCSAAGWGQPTTHWWLLKELESFPKFWLTGFFLLICLISRRLAVYVSGCKRNSGSVVSVFHHRTFFFYDQQCRWWFN